MPLYLRAIIPKPVKPPSITSAQLALSSFGGAVTSEMQTYPASLPWRSRPPKRGLRAGGKRTGDYGRGWSIRWDGPSSLTVGNPVDYAGRVGGFKGHGAQDQKQTTVMARRGWPSITDVVKRLWPKYLGQFRAALSWK